MPISPIREFRKGLRALERQFELALLDQTECCGVTPTQCHLVLAVEELGEASVGELAASLELDASTLSRTVDGLVKTGVLERREDPVNRRRQLVKLAAAGREKADSINAECDRYYSGLLASLPAENVEIITEALPRLVEALRGWRLTEASGSCCGTEKEAVR